MNLRTLGTLAVALLVGPVLWAQVRPPQGAATPGPSARGAPISTNTAQIRGRVLAADTAHGQAHRHHGTVKDTKGQPALDYMVVILPVDLKSGISPTRFVRTVRPNQQGRYETKGLPPGNYYAVAVDSLEAGAEWDPAFQQQVRARAKRLTLEEGQQLSLDLQLE